MADLVRMLTYKGEWPAISRSVRRASPWCVACGAGEGTQYVNRAGRTVRVRLTVDHIRPLSIGGTNERSNLRVLCASCHGSLTSTNWRQR